MFFIYTADNTMPFSLYSADASMKEGNIVVMKSDWCAVNNVLNTSVSEAKVSFFRFANVRKLIKEQIKTEDTPQETVHQHKTFGLMFW